ncbi:Rho termination factor N-terminal domain-containing protein, partial [bacterium]|nr:Rho termination factor N-terminal domain-containing protein [bacterium]
MNKKDLISLTVAELKAEARSLGLVGYSTMRKGELVDLLVRSTTPRNKRRRVVAKPKGATVSRATKKRATAKPKPAAKKKVAAKSAVKPKPAVRKKTTGPKAAATKRKATAK